MTPAADGSMLATLQRIVERHQFERVFTDELPGGPCPEDVNPEDWDPEAGLLVDAQTASVMLQVRAAMRKPSNVEKFDAMLETPSGFVRMTEFCWSQLTFTRE